MNLSPRDVANVLAALRYWQDHVDPGGRRAFPHFGEEEPYSNDQLASLSERINTSRKSPVPSVAELSIGNVIQFLERLPEDIRTQAIAALVNARSDIGRDSGERSAPQTFGGQSRDGASHRGQPADRSTAKPFSMETQEPRQIVEEGLKRLTDDLKAGRSRLFIDYLAAQAKFYRYSWNNVMLIQAQRPDATRVAGYHAWHDLGRFVRKGEHGIKIVAPVLTKQQELALHQTSSKQENVMRLTGFRTAYVFDISQTEGRPLPEFAQTAGDPARYADKLKALVEREGVELLHDRTIRPALGVSTGGQIRLQPGLSPAEEFSTLTHEFAHELLHHGPNRNSISTLVRETQAEAVSFVVSRGIGLETGTAAADYISLYNGDVGTLVESLQIVQQTASRILGELLNEERERTTTHEASQDPVARVEPTSPDPGASPNRAAGSNPIEDTIYDR